MNIPHNSNRNSLTPVVLVLKTGEEIITTKKPLTHQPNKNLISYPYVITVKVEIQETESVHTLYLSKWLKSTNDQFMVIPDEMIYMEVTPAPDILERYNSIVERILDTDEGLSGCDKFLEELMEEHVKEGYRPPTMSELAICTDFLEKNGVSLINTAYLDEMIEYCANGGTEDHSSIDDEDEEESESLSAATEEDVEDLDDDEEEEKEVAEEPKESSEDGKLPPPNRTDNSWNPYTRWVNGD